MSETLDKLIFLLTVKIEHEDNKDYENWWPRSLNELTLY